MKLIKYVNSNGSGDYTNITDAFDDMLASGIAATGDITEYNMMVSHDTYTNVSLSGFIPYSGKFNINFDDSVVYFGNAINSLSGVYEDVTSYNLKLSNGTLITSGINEEFIDINNEFGITLNNIDFIDCDYGIVNSGILYIDNVTSKGNSENYFIKGSGFTDINNLSLSNYATGIYDNVVSVTNSTIHDNNVGIYSHNGYITADNSLFYNNTKAIDNYSGSLVVNYCTSADSIYINSTNLYIYKSIISSSPTISGEAGSGSEVFDSCLYPSGYTDTINISGNNNIFKDPKFNDVSVDDYRLKFGESPCVELYDSSISSGIEYEVDNAQLTFADNSSAIPGDKFLQFTYKNGSSIVLSDHNKETKFANIKQDYGDLSYTLNCNIKFTENNILTRPSFNINADDHYYPWDWDYKEIYTTKIVENNNYIIPRSVINIEDIIENRINFNVEWGKIVKDHIKVYDLVNYCGISYDAQLSSPSSYIIWVLDRNNQSLIKKDTFNDITLDELPLFCPSPNNNFVTVSGVIYENPDDEYYSYVMESDPNTYILGNTDNGKFQWIPTDINTKIDLRGLKASKGILYVTGSRYSTNINDRRNVQTNPAAGMMYWFYNNDIFENYKSPSNDIPLSSGNQHPTDITLYEDKNILISDYSGDIYRYRPAYDYALVKSSYENESRIILREFYQNINI